MKQIAWVYTMLVGLAVLFAGVSLLILVFGARPGLVAKKLKFGSLIIAFNVMLAGCYSSKEAKETATCYSDAPSGAKQGEACDPGLTKGTDSGKTERSTDTDMVDCYASPENPTDTGASPGDTDTIDSEIMCYEPTEVPTDTGEPSVETDTGEPPVETDIVCYDIAVEVPTDTGEPPVETDTGEPSIETDIECYDIAVEVPTDTGEPPMETDIECYADLPYDSDTGPAAQDTDDWGSDVECYAAPSEDTEPDGGEVL